METEPFVVSLGDHGQLLTQREDFHMKQGATSEEPAQLGKNGSEDRAHVADANAGAKKKSTKSIGTKFWYAQGAIVAVAVRNVRGLALGESAHDNTFRRRTIIWPHNRRQNYGDPESARNWAKWTHCEKSGFWGERRQWS